jgi:hypothetical protein
MTRSANTGRIICPTNIALPETVGWDYSQLRLFFRIDETHYLLRLGAMP